MHEKIIEIRNVILNKEKHKILDIDNFSLARNETIVLIGPNGAGKSTLLQVLMLLQQPTDGDFYFKGKKVKWKESLSYRRRMAMVFQESLLLDTTVYNNVAFGMKFRGVPKKQINERIEKWLIKLGIEHLSSRSARKLSGGESQRVSIARALAIEPEVIFLDEPFAALDEPTRNVLIADLADILKITNVSCIIVTHNYLEIPALADKVVVMEEGKIIQEAPPWEVMTRPASLSVANLVGMKNMIMGEIVGYAHDNSKMFVKIGQHDIIVQGNAPAGYGPAYVLIRPEDVQMMTKPDPNRINNLPGKVSKLLPYGHMFTAVVHCGANFTAIVGNDQILHGEITVDKDVWLSFPPDKVHVIAKLDTPLK